MLTLLFLSALDSTRYCHGEMWTDFLESLRHAKYTWIHESKEGWKYEQLALLLYVLSAPQLDLSAVARSAVVCHSSHSFLLARLASKIQIPHSNRCSVRCRRNQTAKKERDRLSLFGNFFPVRKVKIAIAQMNIFRFPLGFHMHRIRKHLSCFISSFLLLSPFHSELWKANWTPSKAKLALFLLSATLYKRWFQVSGPKTMPSAW